MVLGTTAVEEAAEGCTAVEDVPWPKPGIRGGGRSRLALAALHFSILLLASLFQERERWRKMLAPPIMVTAFRNKTCWVRIDFFSALIIS